MERWNRQLEVFVTASTDTGLIKSVNQDSYIVRLYNTLMGKIVLAVLCDGMGGLSRGEVASATVIYAFSKWAEHRLPYLCQNEITDMVITDEWISLLTEYNDKIRSYGEKYRSKMGTTVTALLLTKDRYYVLNVGDSRAYEIGENLKVITKDQSLVAREVELGNISAEEARFDFRRNILLQCVGVGQTVYPDMYFGDVRKNHIYMLCSDGFRHELSSDEIRHYLSPERNASAETLKNSIDYLIEVNKQRNETDNITAVAVKVS